MSRASEVGAAVGVIAGSGRLPFMVVEGAKRAGCRTVVIGLRGEADERIGSLCDRFYRTGLLRLGQWIRIFRREGVCEVILAGRVGKARVHEMARWRQWLRYLPDWTSLKVWYLHSRDKRNDAVLSAAAWQMERKGIRVLESTRYCREAMAPAGLLTAARPDAGQQKDAELGWLVAKALGRLDVGQAVAVREQDILAVEAIEGTDALIERAGRLCPAGGWTLVKVAKPGQDMRFDVPTVGPQTIENLHRAGGRVLVVEAGKTLLIDVQEMVRLADRYGIAVVGRAGEGASAVGQMGEGGC